jgi:hypothetical protein
LLEVADQRQCRAECGVLEAASQFDEGLDLAKARSTRQIRVVHSGLLTYKVPENGGDLYCDG